jgi:hypothetical protein
MDEVVGMATLAGLLCTAAPVLVGLGTGLVVYLGNRGTPAQIRITSGPRCSLG